MSDKRLIVALDVDNFDEARKLVDLLGDNISAYKVGSQLFTAYGPMAVRYLLSERKNVFLDLKFHDIPNTVANAVASVVRLNCPIHDVLDSKGKKVEKFGKVFMCTLHISGGEEMLKSAVESARESSRKLGVQKPLLVGITVLTSDSKKDNIQDIVVSRARMAKEAGLDGVVSSSLEAKAIRRECGKGFVIVTPGIRLEGADAQDQKRVATPAYAIEQGSSYLVVGRPIIKAENPSETARIILEQIKPTKQ